MLVVSSHHEADVHNFAILCHVTSYKCQSLFMFRRSLSLHLRDKKTTFIEKELEAVGSTEPFFSVY
jgi:hypothetical protein